MPASIASSLAYHPTRFPASVLVILLIALGAFPASAQIQPPDAFFGRAVGGDGVLIPYDQQVPYFEHLAEISDRVLLERVGRTTAGREMIMLVVSSPGNLIRLEEYRNISARLDDPRGLSRTAIDSLAARGRAVICVAFNIHSDEIASSQTALRWIHQLVSSTGDLSSEALDEVILLVVPSLNPDGQMMVSDWRSRPRGASDPDSPLPGLYHPYAGHDNNRDWFMLNLLETRQWHEVLYRKWFPQVLVDHHQMGPYGPRMFVPPYTDPVTDHVHPLIHRYSSLLGASMAMGLEREGRTGVIQGFLFDAYWPGGTRSTPWWKNTVGILTETASARGMSPLRVEPGELRGGAKGLVEYQRQVNFPNPWPGGTWRAADIIEYEILASNALIETCARERANLLRDRARMALDAIRRGENEVPRGWMIPARQHDPGTAAALVDLLLAHGIEVQRHSSRPGAYFIPAAQPYRPFLLEMLERQTYRSVRSRPGEEGFLLPYDVTSWFLPALSGVELHAVPELPTGTGTRVATPAWIPSGPPEVGATNWVFPAEMLDSYAATARLMQAGYTARRGAEATMVGGRRLGPGWFQVNAPASALVEALDGLRVRALHRDPVSEPDGTGPPPDSGRSLRLPRVAVYQPQGGSADAGWTRYVLDRFSIPYRDVGPADVASPLLNSRYDLFILPDAGREELVRGTDGNSGSAGRNPASPPRHAGIGAAGVEALDAFVRAGGTLLALGRGTELPLDGFDLPVRRALSGRDRGKVSTPGTSVRVRVENQHPLGFGLPMETAVFLTDSPSMSVPGEGRARAAKVVARYPESGELIVSGHAEGAERLRRQPALVEVTHGRGRVILCGFRPQHRGQTWATYKFLLNALLDTRLAGGAERSTFGDGP